MPGNHHPSAVEAAFEMTPPRSLLWTRRILGGVFLGLLVLVSSPAHRAQAQSGPPGSGWTLTFEDTFQATSVDRSKWSSSALFPIGNSNFSDSEVVEGNGVLQLITEVGGGGTTNTTSGLIHTRETFSQTYGWFEARIKEPPGAGMYSCFWMLSLWPADYREIDIAEWQIFPNTVDVALHTGDWYSWKYIAGQDFTADFHTYAVNWQPDSVTYYIDGVQFFQVTANVPQTPMWMIINSGNGSNVDLSSLPNSMFVQYVRVWQGSGTTQPPPPPPPSGALIGDPNYTQQTQGNGNPLIAPWSGTGPALIGLDSNNGNGPSPTPCGFISSPAGTGWSAITQTGTLSTHTDYTLLAMIQTGSPFPGGTIGVEAPDGTVLAQQAFGEKDAYAPVSVSFNSGSSTTLTIFAGLANNSGSDAWVHVDNWSLTAGSAAPPPPPSTANLIQDPDYTGQTQGPGSPLMAPWGSNGPAMIGVDEQNGMNGSPCGFIYDGGTGAWSDIVQTISVTPNTNYTLSCFIQTDDVFAAQGLMGAFVGDGVQLASKSFGQMSNFTQLTVSFNSGSNTSVVAFAGFTDQGPGAWIHVDTWSMVDPPGSTATAASQGGVAGAGTSGGKAACGLTGLETVLVLGLLALSRRKD
ncbi:MAG TPA: glycoside hydrolase family 16 protein [Planctomycetota bacterium]|nr:glycoside hydrolase family 16 protein [Planctomycetota bacterium]